MALASSLPKTSTLPTSDSMASFNPMEDQLIVPNIETANIPTYEGVYTFSSGMQPSQDIQKTAQDYSAMDVEQPQQRMISRFSPEAGKQPGSNGRPTKPPSFNGDEIDALFHEMAQLDTTEWSSGRVQGLKDFGFVDGSTFEEFCNDPNRLSISEGYMGSDPNLILSPF
ncbi:hypothetical protein KCU88_g7402, partial [Aureobasidium melanogenum]